MADDTTVEVMKAGRYLRLLSRNGWEYVDRTGVSGIVMIAAVTRDDELVLVEQFRPPMGTRVIELPAGLAGDLPGHESERIDAAARRELIEETGYDAGSLRMVAVGPISPGTTTEQVSIYVATDLVKVAGGGGDDAEDIRVHTVPIRGLEDFFAARRSEGMLIDPKIFLGLYFVRDARQA